MRKPFTSLSVVVVKTISPISSKRLNTYLIIMITFILCALFHILASGDPPSCSIFPQTRFYMSTGLAMVAEDIVLTTGRYFLGYPNDAVANSKDHRNIAGSGKHSRGKVDLSLVLRQPYFSFVCRMMGYLWVSSFDFWATSKLVYRSYQCSRGA